MKKYEPGQAVLVKLNFRGEDEDLFEGEFVRYTAYNNTAQCAVVVATVGNSRRAWIVEGDEIFPLFTQEHLEDLVEATQSAREREEEAEEEAVNLGVDSPYPLG